MSRPVVPPEVSQRALSPLAVGHLAHDLRGSIHVIRGHAELLRAEASDDDSRESAGYIFDACGRLSGICEDVIDYLRLPAVAAGETVELALDDLTGALTRIGADRAIEVRMVGFEDVVPSVRVPSTVLRVVVHVLEHVVRTAATDVTITVSIDTPRESGAISVSPAPVGVADGDNAILAMAGELLASRGARVSVAGDTIHLTFPLADSSAE